MMMGLGTDLVSMVLGKCMYRHLTTKKQPTNFTTRGYKQNIFEVEGLVRCYELIFFCELRNSSRTLLGRIICMFFIFVQFSIFFVLIYRKSIIKIRKPLKYFSMQAYSSILLMGSMLRISVQKFTMFLQAFRFQ